jgi:predicted SAM-dependent methyltransferase
MMGLRSKRRIKQLLQNKKQLKFNIGCGTDYKEGWINIDNNSDNNITKLDINWDLRKELPVDDNSVDFIFNEHFFEHLTPDEARQAINNLMRKLKPGGIMRVAMPDLEFIVKDYLKLDLNKDKTLKKFGLDFIKTRAERMNISFRWWGHEWIYDWDELERRFEELGFKKITRQKKGKSSHPQLRNLEIREESKLIAEVTK